jgi:hypothetical protein
MSQAAEFALREGDRVVLLGSTMVERGQSYGYLETLLTSHFADRKLTFRNLGWSGDNVFGHARAGFDAPSAGYKQLVEQVTAARPTVLLIAYGANEAFDGAAGLPAFVAGLNRLLDDVSAARPRIVLFTPPPLESLGPPLPDPTRHNEQLREYAQAIRGVAQDRQLALVDLFDLLEGTGSQTGPLTDNSQHWTPYGYWHAGGAIAQALGLSLEPNRLSIDVAKKSAHADRGELDGLMIDNGGARFQFRDTWLPRPPAPQRTDGANAPPSGSLLQVRGLPPGEYGLTIDGQQSAVGSAEAWQQGIALADSPDVQQAEALRQTIVAKNRLFFYRWRPQNQTYLFGFRKHEQGQNAKEIPQFDPLVAEQEARIHELAQPRMHRYQLLKRSK